ncbi:hypothetical protein [Listeria fleischmannii]|nr:hypothetical protein [Listeria fleischmannii]
MTGKKVETKVDLKDEVKNACGKEKTKTYVVNKNEKNFRYCNKTKY